MLLRGVSKHVRDQNWFAVCLDFFIVVVGVFIGIQVANWNEEQSKLQDLERLLARLEVDLEGLSEDVARSKASYFESALLIESGVAVLRVKAVMPDEDAIAVVDATTRLRWLSPIPNSFEEMVSTGGLDLVDSVEVRSALIKVQGFSQLAGYVLDYWSTVYTNASITLAKHTTTEYDRSLNSSSRKTAGVDTLSLASDEEALSALVANLMLRNNLHEISILYEKAIEDALASIRKREAQLN